MSEGEIIQLLLNKDETGIDALLKNYGPLLRYVIAPILSDERDRDECLSETVMRVWERAEQFNANKGSWNAWLTAVARNTALNMARRFSRDAGRDELPENAQSPEPSPEERVIQQELKAELEQALRRLSSREENIFYRKYYYLQSTAQIAAELGMTERAVEGRIYRIKKRLRAMLGGDGNE